MSDQYTSTAVCTILGIPEMKFRRWRQVGHIFSSLSEGEPGEKACQWSREDLYAMAAYRYLTQECSLSEQRAERILLESCALAALHDPTGGWRETPILCAMHCGESIYSVLSTDWVGGEGVRQQEAEWADVFGAPVEVDAVLCIFLRCVADQVDAAVRKYAVANT